MFHARIADLRDRGFFSRLALRASLFAILSAGASALFAAPAFTATQMAPAASDASQNRASFEGGSASRTAEGDYPVLKLSGT